MQVEADSVGHDLSFGWSRFNRGVHVPPSARQGVDEGEAARQGMAPDADLPAAARFPGEDDEYEDMPPDLPQDEGYDGQGAGGEHAFAELAKDLAQPAETAAPF
jgi:hypothetical protein